MQSIRVRIIEKLQFLPDSALKRVLDFVESLTQKTAKQPVGVPGKQLLRFAGAIPTEDMEQMARAIESDCERVDLRE